MAPEAAASLPPWGFPANISPSLPSTSSLPSWRGMVGSYGVGEFNRKKLGKGRRKEEEKRGKGQKVREGKGFLRYSLLCCGGLVPPEATMTHQPEGGSPPVIE